MTFDERVHAVERKGFTERQARFLTTVMLHAGVCVPRQYARFCGIVYGRRRGSFRQARAAPLRLDVRLPAQPRAHLPRQSARAVRGDRRGGEPSAETCDAESRHPASDGARRHRRRPDLVWLGTAEEKSTHLTTLLRIETWDLPHFHRRG